MTPEEAARARALGLQSGVSVLVGIPGPAGGLETMIKPPEITVPADGAVGFYGTVIAAPMQADEQFYGEHERTQMQIALDGDFVGSMVAEYDGPAATEWTPALTLPETSHSLRARYGAGGFWSRWSDTVEFVTPAAMVFAPSSISADRPFSAPTITVSGFASLGGAPDESAASVDVEVLLAADNSLVWSGSGAAAGGVGEVELPAGTLSPGETYILRARFVGSTLGAGEWGEASHETAAGFDVGTVVMASSIVAPASGGAPENRYAAFSIGADGEISEIDGMEPIIAAASQGSSNLKNSITFSGAPGFMIYDDSAVEPVEIRFTDVAAESSGPAGPSLGSWYWGVAFRRPDAGEVLVLSHWNANSGSGTRAIIQYERGTLANQDQSVWVESGPTEQPELPAYDNALYDLWSFYPSRDGSAWAYMHPDQDSNTAITVMRWDPAPPAGLPCYRQAAVNDPLPAGDVYHVAFADGGALMLTVGVHTEGMALTLHTWGGASYEPLASGVFALPGGFMPSVAALIVRDDPSQTFAVLTFGYQGGPGAPFRVMALNSSGQLEEVPTPAFDDLPSWVNHGATKFCADPLGNWLFMSRHRFDETPARTDTLSLRRQPGTFTWMQEQSLIDEFQALPDGKQILGSDLKIDRA